MVLEPDGISQRSGPEIRSIRWAGVAGLMEIDEHEFVVFGLDGTAIPIGPGLYRGGQELIVAVQARSGGGSACQKVHVLSGMPYRVHHDVLKGV